MSSYFFLPVESVRRTFRKLNSLYNKSHFHLKYCICSFLLLVNLVHAWVYSSPTQCLESLMIRVVNTEGKWYSGEHRKNGRGKESGETEERK